MVLQKAKEFIYRNTRPLDLARSQYHFENGSKKAVMNALSYYQNEELLPSQDLLPVMQKKTMTCFISV